MAADVISWRAGFLRRAAFAVCVSGSVVSFGATVTVTGTPTTDTSTAGSATATANTPGESNTATATGGASSGGGNGGDAAASTNSTGNLTLTSTSTATGGATTGGSNSGNGGTATADATVNSSGTATAATATATATGANSGNFDGTAGAASASTNATAAGGAVRATSVATAGETRRYLQQSPGGSPILIPNRSFGNGASATAAATGITTGAGAVTVSAKAVGGNLSYNQLDTFAGIPIGGDALFGTVYGQSDTGNVSVGATAIGGGALIGTPAQGASVTLSNAVSGQTAGRLSFTQTATGGNSGDFNGSGNAPAGGSATSLFSLTDTLANGLSVTLSATGGQGGSGRRGQAMNGGDGGNATVGGSIAANGAVSLTASATGGAGGFTAIGRAGAGGMAIVQPLSATSLNNQAVTVSVTGTGGTGGWYDPDVPAAGGGDGADAVLINRVDGVTTGALTLSQTATGGAAGKDNFATPRAGRGDSWLTKSGAFSSLTLTARGTGGVGADFGSATSVAPGGVGQAHADATSTSGTANSTASATGGVGGRGSGTPGVYGGGAGPGGVADSSAAANAIGAATASASAMGGMGGNLFSSFDSPGTFTGAGGGANGLATAVSSGGTATATTTILGGAGGLSGSSSSQTASGGLGGDASGSALAKGSTGATASVTLTGGVGGTIQGPTAVGGNGGNVNVTSASAQTADGPAVVNVTATGGAGGTIYRSAPGGQGGGVTIKNVSAVSTLGNATASVLAIGGAGSTVTTGSSTGASVFLNNTVTGQAAGTLSLTQEARGGAGTVGGLGRSELRFDRTSAKTLNLTTIATSGIGVTSAGAISNVFASDTGASTVSLVAQAKSYANGIAQASAGGMGLAGTVSATGNWAATGAAGSRTIAASASISATPDLRHGASAYVGSSAFTPPAVTDIQTIARSLSGTEDLSAPLADNPNTAAAPGSRLGLFGVAQVASADTKSLGGTFSGSISLGSTVTNPFVTIGLFDGSLTGAGTLTLTASIPSGGSFTIAANDAAGIAAQFHDNVNAMRLASTDTSLTYSGTYTRAQSSGAFGLSLLVGQASTAATNARYFTGSQNAVWSSNAGGLTNFATTSQGNVGASVPSSVSDVYLAASANAKTSNFNTTLGGDLTINSLTLGGGENVTIGVSVGGTNTLTILAGAGAYAGGTGLVMQSGSATNAIGANVVIGSSQTWTNNSVNDLSVTGNVAMGAKTLTIAGSGNVTLGGALGGTGGLLKSGVGTLQLTATNTYAGSTTVTGGTLRASQAASSSLLANAGGLDLKDGRIVLDADGPGASMAKVQLLLAAGYASHFATGQIRSTGLAAGRTIGYGDDGGGAVALTLTLPGDATLDGLVDFNDFLALQNNFNQGETTFAQGNFNYDAITDFNDFLMLQNNFGQTLSGARVQVTAAQAAAMVAFANSDASLVPEPTSLAMIGLGVGFFGRRRRAV